MASVINKLHGALMKPFTATGEALGQAATGPATYLWRAKILVNRATSLKAQRFVSPLELDPAKKMINTGVSALQQKKRQIAIKVPKPKVLNKPTVSTVRNEIVIINPNPTGESQGYQSLTIQGMPSEVNIETDNTWVAVKSAGRNNPLYIYTGSEDTISFDISWYSLDKDRKDVIRKCRLLESWSKANGYISSPPELWISWGASELFKDDSFILAAAPYTLTNFQNAYRVDRTSPIIDLGLIPNAAVQKLTFKRVTKTNRTHTEIQNVGGSGQATSSNG